MRNIFRTGIYLRSSSLVHTRSRNIRISNESRDLQGQRSGSQGHVMRLTVCWPISRERNVLETPELLGRLSSTCTGNNAHQFQGQRQGSMAPGRHNVETGSASYFPNGKAYELQTWCGTPVDHALSTVTPSYKAVKFGSCTRAGHTVSAAHGGHAAC